ncbi:OmpH family outer membrane protein [Pseudenhygromyxa sp. WMMC2535]|uniref:OmpH family outer membrane protein n=1 Tax=Pseudenhygromyxa sp. WMMC2535 TaxID=2712867 RepID=UPI001551CC41|nr:OmpH family outer membrane protein [Pseudenhygromyxa sp. WMMC2535]NVB41487.1 OmpH family outer membrane protein [Pseudenhygromyxa sp. WMMC2535]
MRLRTRSLLLASTLAVSALGVSATMLAPVTAAAAVPQTKKIALVDLQRVLLETTQGKKAKKNLESAIAKSGAKLERKAKDLQSKFDDLQAKAAMLSEAELMRRSQELQAAELELQQLYQEEQEDLLKKEELLMEKIYKNTAAIVKAMAKEEGIQIVMVRSELTVLYANPQLDVTNKVIVAYDKKFK